MVSAETSGINLAASSFISALIMRRSLQRRTKPAASHSWAYFAWTIRRASESTPVTRFKYPLATIPEPHPLLLQELRFSGNLSDERRLEVVGPVDTGLRRECMTR